MMQFQGSSEQKTCRKKNDSNKDSLQVKAGVIFKQLFSNVFAKLVEANSLWILEAKETSTSQF